MDVAVWESWSGVQKSSPLCGLLRERHAAPVFVPVNPVQSFWTPNPVVLSENSRNVVNILMAPIRDYPGAYFIDLLDESFCKK